MTAQRPHLHAFTTLELAICEQASGDEICGEYRYELRAIDDGAEIWQSSVLRSGSEPCASELRYIGVMGSRRVIEMLTDLERSGIYERPTAAEALAAGEPLSDDLRCSLITMRVSSATANRTLLEAAPSDELIVTRVVQTVRQAVSAAQERSLCWAG